jgi:hypothetical protein
MLPSNAYLFFIYHLNPLQEITMSTRRQTLKSFGATGIAAVLGFPVVSRAQAPAVESLRIIVGFPPGGTSDAFARRLSALSVANSFCDGTLC